MDGICKVNSTLPTAQQTQLGWILSGNTKTFQCNVVLHNFEAIQNFWEIEDISEKSDLSLEDNKCIEFYKATTKRREDGRYEVRLPLLPDYKEKLGNSKSKAIAQFYNLERKLECNKIIKNDYVQFIDEYLSLGHMTPATDDRSTYLRCYLPHHCVTRSDSTTTKLRVVFNASSKTLSGSSLNDVMYRGPNLQQDLFSLVIKWRQFKYAFTADIEKMFRQIWINPEDQNLQMILWRDSPNKNLLEYHLATISYGTKAAPFLAMMTLKQLAHDERSNFQDSLAPSVLEESFYMDDLIHGTHSLQAAKQLQTDMINLLKKGGFHLRKWKSNSPELLKHVDVTIQHQDCFDFKQVESTKTLGLGLAFSPHNKLKILFQDVWRENLAWDQLVPQHISEKWCKIKQDIDTISQFQVPRWLQTQENDLIELHGFCDASTKAYGSVVYCKITRNNNSSVVLVAGKTKLVPLSKKCSLPRLELCGAVLLSKLMAKIKKCLVNYNITVYGWVDSILVLGWLNGQVDRWKPFVANRVKQVTYSMSADCWRYVASKENPADCASRGLTASQLREHSLWWLGPAWLPTYIPEKQDKQIYSTNQDLKAIKQVNIVISGSEIIKKIIEKQSSLSKAVRILAWILRFTAKAEKQSYLSIIELNRARNLIIKNCQIESFSQEIHSLKLGKAISKQSKLFSLNPILDENDILRVGGRLRHANIDAEMKHPAIIPCNTRLAELIIDQAHEFTYHGGARLTTSIIRRKYWLIGGNNATKKRLRMCVKCRRHNPDLQQQIMGDLPSARTNPSRPFFHCGVDYTGHVNVKCSKGRGIKTTKGYISVFVCMATKAVHLELVSDLSTSAFLAALRRMIARRGLPGHIYSDQGKNFIGANNVLQQQLTELQESQEFKSEIVEMGIEWHHNCPSWPSAGGLWEAAVKSLKHHLKRVVGEQNLTFEEFTTLLTQLEGCLNSRPLCPLTEDPDDLNFLTPSHFLSSGPILTLYDTETDLRTRWHLNQKIFNDIWNRWREEYLTLLTARSKWREPKSNIKLGDIVIIKDDNLPPGKWALGRVVELHPGSDGYVRVVTLKTKNGFMKRPVIKLCRLPVNENVNQISSTDINK
ncbi:unnamed protein product [Colias eurytheme]|nr:unnamed protein product [Colias eurytheme]